MSNKFGTSPAALSAAAATPTLAATLNASSIADGTSGQALVTDGSGTYSFGTVSTTTIPFTGCVLKKATLQTCTSGSPISVTWDSQDVVSGITHSTSTNNSRITIDTTGVYHFTCSLDTWNASLTNTYGFSAYFFKNGVDTWSDPKWGLTGFQRPAMTANNHRFTLSAYIPCTSGDYMEVKFGQNSGYTVDMGSGNVPCRLGVTLVGTTA